MKRRELNEMAGSLNYWYNQIRRSLKDAETTKNAESSPEPGGFEVTLSQDFDECERGNILIVGELGFNAWLELDDDKSGNLIYLQISWRPANFPALSTTLCRIKPADLFEHLVKSFDSDWTVSKFNLHGYEHENLLKAWREKGERDGTDWEGEQRGIS